MTDKTVVCGDGVTRSVKQLQSGSHREAYPEQYSHPRCGETVRVMHNGEEIRRGKIDRVVPSRFGLLCALDDMSDSMWALASCEKLEVIVVPVLDHDAMMLERFGTTVTATGHLERRIVAALIGHMLRAGFQVHSVHDGEVTTRIRADNPPKEAMELIFNLDEASLRFYKTNPRESHGVLLVLGNGCDILSDWNYFDDDRDGFNAAMDAFDSEAI
jgi:hypothetical protein